MENISIVKMPNLKESDSTSDVDPIRKSIKYGTTYQAAKGIIYEYFNESSIHGLKYISDSKRSGLDRIIWLCALAISIVVCCFLIAIIWEKSTNNPAILAFDEKPIHIWEIPFPSVTICPQTKSQAHIFSYMKCYSAGHLERRFSRPFILDGKEKYFYEAISQTCLRGISEFDDFSPGSKHVANASSIIEALLEAAPTSETLVSYTWKGTFFYKSFHYALTEEGICHSFNSPRSEIFGEELYTNRNKHSDKPFEWTLEDGYDKQAGEDAFPYRTFGAANGEGLKFELMDKKRDEDLICRDNEQGFKVIFHTPGDEPQVSKNFIIIPAGKSISLAIIPTIVKTSEGLRSYQAKRRKCYYQGEMHLKYFKNYTQANCELECLANETLAECQCVKFSMPRNSTHPVCGTRSVECLNNVKKNSSMHKYRLESNVSESTTNNIGACYNKCLPTCFSIQYRPEIKHQIEYDYLAEARYYGSGVSAPDILSNGSRRLTQVKINFKDDIFTGLRRSEMYTTTDFIASFGGLLGLFMGVSILSLVEIIYFFTIRLWMNLQTRRRKKLVLNKSKVNEKTKEMIDKKTNNL